MTNFNEKNVLAIDSASNRLILGLAFNGDRLVKSDDAVEQSHGQLIYKKIGELFQSANLSITQLDGLIVQTGPGSFTGLRIGIAAAKSLAVANQIPIASINLFEMAAFKLQHVPDEVNIIIPLKKDQFFTTTVANGNISLIDVRTVNNSELLDLMKSAPFAAYNVSFENDLDATFKDLSSEIYYDAADIYYLGIEKMNHGKFDDIVSLEPLYLQKSQAEINFDLRNKK